MSAAALARRLVRHRRMAWRPWAWRAIPLLCLALAVVGYGVARYKIGIDSQLHRSLPGNYRILLVDTWNRGVERGGMYAFAVEGLEPVWPDGQLFVKIADGLPGDQVGVTRERTTVNGDVVGDGLPLAAFLELDEARFERALEVPPGHYWMMGKTPDSFDSRYWGLLPEDRLVGRAYFVW